jgi:predicted site-specific integrase-resolvase
MTNIQSLITAKEVSEILSIGLSTVYAYSSSGILPCVNLPRTRCSVAKKRNKSSVRFRVDDIQSFMDNLN